MPISLKYHPFEPSEPEAATPQKTTPLAAHFAVVIAEALHKTDPLYKKPTVPAAEPVNTWARRNEHAKLVADQGPRVDTRRVPPGYYFCAECGKTPEPCHHFSRSWPTTQATEARQYTNRHGEPCSEACGQGRHAECTETMTTCNCTYRGLHKTMHRYATIAPPEATTQQIEQPAVEPQKLRMCASTCLGEIKDCPRAGSTRPEMPPNIDRVTLAEHFAHEYAYNLHPDEAALTALFLKYYNECTSRFTVAASVQQEPLSDNVLHEAHTAGDVEIEFRKIVAKHAAAPRTQGREPVKEVVSGDCPSTYGDERFECTLKAGHKSRHEAGGSEPLVTWANEDLAQARTQPAHVIKLHSHGGNSANSCHDWEMSDGSIATMTTDEASKYRQPQPAPKCPKCGSTDIKDMQIQCNRTAVACEGCGETTVANNGLKYMAQFFTALPETTKDSQ